MGRIRKKKGILVLVAILAMSISIVGLIGVMPVMGYSGDVINCTLKDETMEISIDGVIGENEWINPHVLNYSGIVNVTLWAMNDGNDLYIAVKYPAGSEENRNIIGFSFDTDHNEALTDGGEDGVVVITGTALDGHYNESGIFDFIGIDTECGGTNDVTAAGSWSGGNWTVEWKKPLNSGDQYDMNVSPGDTMGIWSGIAELSGITATEAGGVSAMLVGIAWPSGSSGNDASTYGEIVLAEPDLIVTEIKPNCGYLFANESNNISATVKNNGTGNVGAFNISFNISGVVTKVSVPGLGGGETTTVEVTDDNTTRKVGESVTINVTVDCNDEVGESNEANNVMNISKTVVNNGYKGKRYTGGEDIKTMRNYTLNGSVVYSIGGSYYLDRGTNWATYMANWTTTDLPVPMGSNVKNARLYVYYHADRTSSKNITDYFTLTFNEDEKLIAKEYKDGKGFGSWDWTSPVGMVAYNVTNKFNMTSNNTVVLTNSYPGGGNVSIAGMVLVVVYSNSDEPERMIWINEGLDLLYAKEVHCVNSTEATAYAPFAGAGAIEDPTNKSAKLITVAPYASDGDDKNRLYFNTGEWHGIWGSYAGSTNLGISETDVSEYLNATNNTAVFQSHKPTGATKGDFMAASNAILVVTTIEDTEAPVVTNATASPDSIPDDTDNEPLWGENSTLNVTVTGPSGIASVTINLSQIGGPETAEMTNIEGTDIWSITTNVSEGMTSPFVAGNYTAFLLYVNATDSLGNSNTSVFITLMVINNGDVSENDDVTLYDAMYLAKWYYDKPGFDAINERVADVSGNGDVTLYDAMYLAKWYYDKPGFDVLK